MDQGLDQGVGGEIKRLRNERDWSMARLAVEADMSVSGVSMIENGKRNLTTTTLAKLAGAFGIEVADLFPKAQAPLPDFEERRAAEPLSPQLRRFAAWMRGAQLDRMYKHLTLRLETLSEQAKAYFEAGDSQGLWTVFMDASTLPVGAETLLAESREEARNFGGETEEERHFRPRIEHRIEDFEEASKKIGDMWRELLDAANEAKEGRNQSPGNVDELQAVRKRRAG